MFEAKDVAEYYNTTQNHYQRWWGLNKSHSLHYGIWDDSTRSFSDAIYNTNRVLLDLSKIKKGDHVLDAGCGVGGAAVFISEQTGAQVTGITLSEKQLDFARSLSKEKGLSDKVNFEIRDYTDTHYNSESFDVIWACESVCNSADKEAFIKEAFRVLKPGGRLILCDFFLTNKDQSDPKELIRKWGDSWAMSNLYSGVQFVDSLKMAGFIEVEMFDYTDKIERSARKMYFASILGAIPSEIYNVFNPKVTRFARNHYKCGYYQYLSLKKNLWKYMVILANKP
ncbi:MAG: methyltransferase domain-containing protein [Flavobacteriales bacterium]|nr:methyltransferase domain-containing protein [Flavobacteriales bacterium]